MPCHALRVQGRHQVNVEAWPSIRWRESSPRLFATLVAAAVLGACSAPSAPEAGNHLDTAPPVSAAAAGTTSVPVSADNTSETSTAPASAPTTTRPTAPVFVPPSTTLPDDPDLREAIRVRIAVEAEYRRQARAGIADAAAFEGLADPDTWLKLAIADLESASPSNGETAVSGTVNGLAILSRRL